MSADARFERYVERLSDAETLQLHKIVSRRAAAIYEPIHRARQKAGYEAAMVNRHLFVRPKP